MISIIYHTSSYISQQGYYVKPNGYNKYSVFQHTIENYSEHLSESYNPTDEEIKEFYIECDEDDNCAIKCPDGKFRKLDTSKATGYSFELEHNDTPDCGQLDILRKHGDVCGLVFGHDHVNSFTGELDGVNIVQTSGASFRCYGNPLTRGVRVFTLDENDTTSFSTYQIGYFDLFGKKLPSVLRYIFSADEYEKVKAVIIALTAVVGVCLAAYIISILNLFI